MNAAFLLMTSALLVGQPAAEKVPAPPPAATSCASDCDCPGFGHRLRGLFKRDCDSCKPARCEHACHTKCERTPLFTARCRDACAPKCWKWEPKCREPKCHAPRACAPACAPVKCAPVKCAPACAPAKCAPAKCAPACAPAKCDPCERQGLLAKLRGRLHRDHCCDSCAPAAPAKGIEKIDTPPKKLDKGKTEEVQFESRSTPNVIRVAPTAPSVEVIPVPVPAPRVDGDRRDPF